MPAEWTPHAATWLAWPHNQDTWSEVLPAVERTYVDIIRALHPGEHVHICVNDHQTARGVRSLLANAGIPLGRVTCHTIPTNDAWARDYCPIFVLSRPPARAQLGMTCWRFNAWGRKYPPWELDDSVSERIAARVPGPRFRPDMVLEGGSIDVNGRGTLLTTEACLLNPNRNPGLTRLDVERTLASQLGARCILWLRDGIAGDDTDGHIDDLARFVNPTTVVCAVEDDPTDINYGPLRENLRRLTALTDQDDRPLTIVPLPMPGPIEYQSVRLPASYANFYIANAVVLVPTFGRPNDARALAILARFFPMRRVIGIPSTCLVHGLGAIHCITMQQPALAAGQAPAAHGATLAWS